MSLFQTVEFLKLKEYWDLKLKEVGFQDIESNGRLKQKNTRTIAYQNRARISEFFTKVVTYLNEVQDIPTLDREILYLYAEGLRIKGPDGIIVRVNRSDKTVRNIIRKYKLLILRY